MKCLDCGFDIAPDEVENHEGHDVVEGWFDKEEQNDIPKR